MRRLALTVFVGAFACTGCNRGPSVVVAPPAQPAANPPVAPPVAQTVAAPVLPFPALELSPRDKYDAAVWSAVTLLTDRKYAKALASLEQARRAVDTEQVGQEIARIKLCRDAAKPADRIARAIQAVLSDGNPDEAARLATAALREFGESDAAAVFIRLKRQADALASVPLDGPTRLARFRLEAAQAAQINNLRAAALAYEQCLIAGDTTVRPRLSEVQAILGRYDDARRRAVEFRQAGGQFDEALAACKAAAAAWNTAQAQQDIEECTFALQSRPERLAVIEFEARADGGSPRFGQLIADDLLPAFKTRFEVVEGEQVVKVCDDLRLRVADLIDEETGRRELARLTKVRYLVTGTTERLDGIVVDARLLDLQTGLVVQTASVTAPTPTEVRALLPQLAGLLQMGDDQRLAYEQQLARQAAAIPVAVELTAVPPAAAPTESTSEPPIVCTTARPPDPGGVAIEDFRQLSSTPQAAAGFPLAITGDHKLRARALTVAVELGDSLFRHRRYREAQTQFQVALNFSPKDKELLGRLEQCTPYIPAVVAGRPRDMPPRLAVLDFAAVGDSTQMLPGLGTWTAENVAPYLNPPYDVADRGEVNWYMARLGMTLRDVVVDPIARWYLGRVLNVRFLVLGTIQTTPAGLQVVAHLLDTRTGIEVNTAAVLARDRGELKCRLGEIARWLLLDPDERGRRQADTEQAQAVLIQAEEAAKQLNLSRATELTMKARLKTPGIRADMLLDQFERKAQSAALEQQRRAAWEQTQAVVAAAAVRQQELAAAADAARATAVRVAVTIDAADRQQRRDAACQQLLVQARAANDAQNFTLALQIYESILAIDRKSEAVREREAVQMRLTDRARAQATVDNLAREAVLRHERAAELDRIRVQLDAERLQRAVGEKARRQNQDLTSHDLQAKHAAEAAEAKRQAGLRAALDADAQLRANVEAERQAEAKAKADAEARAKKADADAKARADAEKAARDADSRPRQQEEQQRRDAYTRLMTQGRTAFAERRLDDAQRAFAEALKTAPNDPQAAGSLKQAQDAARIPAPLPPPPPGTRVTPLPPPSRPSSPVPPPPSLIFAQHMQTGAALEKQENYADALKAYQAALAIDSADPTAIRRADFARHMDAGVTALKSAKKPDAAREFEAARKLAPNDPAAIRWLQQARR